MQRSTILITALFAVLVLPGCASMSADECLLSDWEGVGYEDGSMGHTGDRLGQHRKACAKHGVTPDFEAYQRGRESGLREYCQPARGFLLGERGGRYNGVCAADQEDDFVQAYLRGHQLYTLRSNVNEVDARIAANQQAISGIDASIRDTEAALVDRETPNEQRILLLADLKRLAEERGRLEADIDNLAAERAFHLNELASYEAMLANNAY